MLVISAFVGDDVVSSVDVFVVVVVVVEEESGCVLVVTCIDEVVASSVDELFVVEALVVVLVDTSGVIVVVGAWFVELVMVLSVDNVDVASAVVPAAVVVAKSAVFAADTKQNENNFKVSVYVLKTNSS